MYDVIKALVWTGYLKFVGPIFFLWFVSSLINLVTLKSYGVKWYIVAMIPFSHNIYKLSFTDDPPVPWVVGLVPVVLGVLSWITWSPIGTILYLLSNVAVNYVFGRSLYDKPVLFALVPFYRYFAQLKCIIDERRAKSHGK